MNDFCFKIGDMLKISQILTSHHSLPESLEKMKQNLYSLSDSPLQFITCSNGTLFISFHTELFVRLTKKKIIIKK